MDRFSKIVKDLRWIENTDGKKQYFSVCPKEMAMHLKVGKPKTIQKLREKTENYVEAHADNVVFGIDPKSSSIRSLRSGMQQCRNCSGFGHLQHQCPTSSSPRSVRENPTTSASPQNSPRLRRAQQSWSGYERQSLLRICRRLAYRPTGPLDSYIYSLKSKEHSLNFSKKYNTVTINNKQKNNQSTNKSNPAITIPTTKKTSCRSAGHTIFTLQLSVSRQLSDP